jgi:hypothetical protein
MGHDRSVSKIAIYGLNNQGSILGRGRNIFLDTKFILTLGPTQSAMKCVPEVRQAKLTTHFHSARLRLRGNKLQFPYVS